MFFDKRVYGLLGRPLRAGLEIIRVAIFELIFCFALDCADRNSPLQVDTF